MSSKWLEPGRDEDPDPVLYSTDPEPDPTCNNGFINLFYLEQNINIFFLHFDFRSDPDPEPDP